MKLQLLAIPLLLALMLPPLAAAAATGSIAFTSPASGTTLTGTTSYTIAGTITPTPTLPDNVFIEVTNPSSTVVDAQTVAVSSTGTFSYATSAGGTSSWTTGTYTITATDSYGTTGTTTFKYTAVAVAPAGTTVTVVANSNRLVYAGQTAQIYAMAYWNNGSALAYAVWTVSVLGPTGSPATSITWAASSPAKGVELWTATLPASTSDGVYAVDVSATESAVTGITQTSFQVNSQIASATAVSALATALTTITTDVTGIPAFITSATSSLSGITSSVSGITTTLSGVTTSLSGITGSLSSLSSSVSTLTTNVSNNETYILVVAALVVITLVLELAILIRRMPSR